MASSQESNGEENHEVVAEKGDKLRKSYHDLSNKLVNCSIDPNVALENATEMLEQVGI